MRHRLLITIICTVLVSLNINAAKDKRIICMDTNGNEYSCLVLSDVEKTVSITTTGNTMGLKTVNIPQTIEIAGDVYTVIAISPGFGMGVREIILPTTIRMIENKAFFMLKSLEKINLPEGLVSIGKQAFSQCTGLKSLYVPNSVKSIGMLCFWGTFKPLDINYENLPPIVNASNCANMGIHKDNFNTYLAQHSASSQPQVIYVQQETPVQPVSQPKQQPEIAEKSILPSSDVDIDIPKTRNENQNLFAVIIANENYQEEVNVDYALNDGEVFKTYCNKVLGIPEQ